ncbi:MAG: Glu/Leu/Phe/Val dehydrogenase [Bacteroidetes bacterium]|nr:MAG: Glu/Leu/Phe/Val dehydrogenase [Bacteroidota bacterium]
MKSKIIPHASKSLFDELASMGHEQILICSDPESNLKAIIAVHNTVLGPAMGGARMWSYSSEADAMTDVLRLSRGMTFKNALAGLNIGGGKAVIIGDPRQDQSEVMMRSFGRFIKNMNGKYITAEDVGMTMQSLEYIAMETKYVAGLPKSRGGSGNPSPMTALGTYVGIKAAVKKVFGTDSLNGKKIAVQGVGHVGEILIDYLVKENAKVFVSDMYADRLKAVADKYKVETVNLQAIYDLDLDVYSPCALGATINDSSLERIKAPIIAGCANNQLADEKKHGDLCLEKKITYVPDFLINAGGVINIATEIGGTYNESWARAKTENLYNIVLEVLNNSEKEQRNAQEIATEMAMKRIQQIGRIKANY